MPTLYSDVIGARAAGRRTVRDDGEQEGEAGRLDEAMGLPAPIDKSAFDEPKRRRAPDHLRFAQLRALGRKVLDDFTVPLCLSCHWQLHSAGDKKRSWRERGVEPMLIAECLWLTSQGRAEAVE